ncbi:MAG: hypothetical protein RMJ87_00710 [Cytophagales bacterium]|nr:hypothetical protein [Bernardetiaceae bacterium]MDW8203522.1 hypothetical protein [Cytophagales bacterium]
MIQIKGKITYQHLATGCWGVIDDGGRKWRIVNPPAELQKSGLEVHIEAQPVAETVSIFMWGTPVEVIRFSILS